MRWAMTPGKQKLLVYSLWCERKSMSLSWDTKTQDSPLRQNLSRWAQDTTCDQMNEANSTSQHFDPVSKFSIYNLNPPEIIWVPCSILPHKKKNQKHKEKGDGHPSRCHCYNGQRLNQPQWLRWEREQKGGPRKYPNIATMRKGG